MRDYPEWPPSMIRVCPNPIPWMRVHEHLLRHLESHRCAAPPPRPLILSGWNYSNDLEKLERWKQTIEWADRNGCGQILADLPEHDFYFVDKMTSYTVGPLGGPMYLQWDYASKDRPSGAALNHHLESLRAVWSTVVDEKLSRATRPLRFTGRKARRLVVHASGDVLPPWGSWWSLSRVEIERRSFTRFRAAINAHIEPHHVDHVGFCFTDLFGGTNWDL